MRVQQGNSHHDGIDRKQGGQAPTPRHEAKEATAILNGELLERVPQVLDPWLILIQILKVNYNDRHVHTGT